MYLRTLLCVLLLNPLTAVGQDKDNIGHTRHLHRHNEPHPTVAAGERFVTDRSGHPLRLPVEDDAFMFAVFGDRTGGPAVGVSVLADAVRDVNLLEPDFVMTVGDLINGYDQTPVWMRQMKEYKEIMGQLLCPWFPVAGNHDVYYRGPVHLKPEGEHEANYEMHFGPLWYAFSHKNCWFIVLYTDEGNPETGEKTFRKPDAQRMSPAQFSWLKETLSKASGADHVFVFVHHPRWLGRNYGEDWNRVHDLLVAAGNVSAVFAGHIHRMRSDPRDGIEYITLATVGGHQSGMIPKAGFLHHYNLVTVRKQQIALASVPVGEIMDVREISGALVEQTLALAQQLPKVGGALQMNADGSCRGKVSVALENPTERPVEVTLTPHSADSRWRFGVDHLHRSMPPGGAVELQIPVRRQGNSFDDAFRQPQVVASMEYLAEGARYPIPDLTIDLPLRATLQPPPRPSEERALSVSKGNVVMVDSAVASVPEGPFTVECWFKAERFGRRTGLIAKTENSGYGIFVSNGVPEFMVLVGNSYLQVSSDAPILQADVWHHAAGVYDGEQARLYIDGKLIASASRRGPRRTNELPLIIGADVDGGGKPVSFFEGLIDGVRLSRTARYIGPSVTIERRYAADADTQLLLNMDGVQGVWLFDESSNQSHPRLHGTPTVK